MDKSPWAQLPTVKGYGMLLQTNVLLISRLVLTNKIKQPHGLFHVQMSTHMETQLCIHPMVAPNTLRFMVKGHKLPQVPVEGFNLWSSYKTVELCGIPTLVQMARSLGTL